MDAGGRGLAAGVDRDAGAGVQVGLDAADEVVLDRANRDPGLADVRARRRHSLKMVGKRFSR